MSGQIRKSNLQKIFVFLLAVMMTFGTVTMLNAESSYADATTVSPWNELKTAIGKVGKGGTQTITLSGDFAYDGSSIEIPKDADITISGSGTIYSSNQKSYESMFKVKGKLTIDRGVSLSAKIFSDGQPTATCPSVGDDPTYTEEKFTGGYDEGANTYTPKGFFIDVADGGEATLNGTLSNFITSKDKETTPRYVAPVVANGYNATFNLGKNGVIKNNTVGYIVDEDKAYTNAQTIKQYVKGTPPNSPRRPGAYDQKQDPDNYKRVRSKDAGIDGGSPGTGITGTAGAIIFKDGAKGDISGSIDNNRGDTGGIMASGEGASGEGTDVHSTAVHIKGEGTEITRNVGVQFGGGCTTEQGALIAMHQGTMKQNVAWFGGGAVYATENGVDWLLGHMTKDGGAPDFNARKDGRFVMGGGRLTENTAFTRGGAILVDSDGVFVSAGKLTNNMSWMLGGAVYVMGDHPLYTYTMRIDPVYVHDNTAVSGLPAAREQAAGKGTSPKTLNDLNDANAMLQRKLEKAEGCSDSSDDTDDKDLFNGTIDDNTDDNVDGKGNDGTGGGVWLCPFGSVLFDAKNTSNVVIDSNYATGTTANSAGISPDASYNSKPSPDSRSGISGGSDLHTDQGKQGGGVSITGLSGGGWINENTGSVYSTETSSDRTNLVSTRDIGDDDVPNKYREGEYVDVSGNIARRGGGLASDGKFFFGPVKSVADVKARMKVSKRWTPSAEKEPIAIRVIAEKGTTSIKIADVPLDGTANEPLTEFDTTSELAPNGNTWTGQFDLPYIAVDGDKSIQLYSLFYTENGVEKEIKLDTVAGREKLGGLINTGNENKVIIRPVDGVTISFKEMNVTRDSEGNLTVTDDEHTNHIFTPGTVDFRNLKLVKEKAEEVKEEYIKANGEIDTRPAYGTYTAGLAMQLESSNDNEAIVEKYVNEDVHSDIVNFDQDFKYDIMAYVPLSAKSFEISDTLVEGLEFADKDGKKVTDKTTVEKISIKTTNDHKPNGSVSNGGMPDRQGQEIDLTTGDAGITISNNNKLEVSINEDTKYKDKNGEFKNALAELRGRWIQVTFHARIKDELRNMDALKAKGWLNKDDDKYSSQRHNVTVANGDIVLANALFNQFNLEPDPIIWAVEGPSRLFAKTASGNYYATPMDDRDGNTWNGPLEEGSPDWTNADNRYNGRPPYNTKRALKTEGSDAALVAVLKDKPTIKGSTLVKGAEGQSRIFIEVKNPKAITGDNENGREIYATTEEDKKNGIEWEKLTPGSAAYNNAVKRLSNDKYTLRMLDFQSESITLSGDGPNWPVISNTSHEGMVNKASYDLTFSNNHESRYESNKVTIEPETTKLEIEKIWKNVVKNALPSTEDFKSMLVLKNSDGTDVSKEYLKNLEVTARGMVYTAKWINLPADSYTVDEKSIPGFEKSVSGSLITNTKKPEKEKPEIEKYVNQAVHKDIKLDEVFTYDIIAYVTKDADSVTITDTLNSMLRFEGTASDVKVADLGTADNHLVTNNISGAEVNKNATVSTPGTPIKAAQVKIDGKKLTVFITNKLKKTQPSDHSYVPVDIETINPAKEGYYEKVDDEYVVTSDKTPAKDKKYYTRSEDDSFTEVTIESVDPSAKGYYEKSGNEYTETSDSSADPEKTYYVREEADENEAGYEYDGDDQPVTALRGHWIRVTFNARIDDKTLEQVKAAYQTINANHVFDGRDPENKGNAPVISIENHTGIPNDAGYTIGVANEAGIKEDAYKDSSNIVTVKPDKDEPTVKKLVNDGKTLVIKDANKVFHYTITSKVPYEAKSFKLYDNVPAKLAIVKKDDIKITVNGKTLSKAERDSILTIKGNRLEVVPTAKQLADWKAFDIKVVFYTKIKDAASLKNNEEIINEAFINVDGNEYGDEGEKTATIEFKKPNSPADNEDKGKTKKKPAQNIKTAKTGDDFNPYPAIYAMLASLLVIAALARRRKSM